jgi:hypothetical protein
LPRLALPWRTDTDEGDHGAIGVACLAVHQINGCVRNDDLAVLAQGWNFEQFLVEPAGPHRLVEAPPVHGPKGGRDDDVEASAECIIC